MKPEITKEILLTLYTRVVEFARIRLGVKDITVEIESDGTLTAMSVDYYGGEREERRYEIKIEDLTTDLDEVAAIRKKEEAEAFAKQEAHRLEMEQREKVYAQERRKAQYLELKKEFE